jgi:C-terminal processing protease CtpA/Prc
MLAAALTAVIPTPMIPAIRRRALWAAVGVLMVVAGGAGGLAYTLWRAEEERTRVQASAAADARRKADEAAAARETARREAAEEQARQQAAAERQRIIEEARQKDAAPSHPPQKRDPNDHCGGLLPEGSPFYNFFCHPHVKELGLSIRSRADHSGPVTITKIDQDSDAEQKGLKIGDEIITIAQYAVRDAVEIMKAIDDTTKKGGKDIVLFVKSGEATRFVAVRLKL